MTSKILSGEINQFNRIFWMIINIFFGGFVGLFMIVWVSCDMQMLVYLFLVLPYSLHSIFHVPWFVMNLSLPLKILFNACLFANFGFVHTFFAQDYVQESIIRWIPFPKSALRTCYLVLTNIAAWILMGFWQHTSIPLWDLLSYFPIDNDFDRHKILLILFVIVNTPGKNLSDVIFFFSNERFFTGACVVIQFDHWEFFGFKQIFQSMQYPILSRTTGMKKLVVDGVFRYCRHPMYLFLLLGFLLSPKVSLDKFLFVLFAIIYLYIAIPIEERKLEKMFGQSYLDYKSSVPAIVPNVCYKKKQRKF